MLGAGSEATEALGAGPGRSPASRPAGWAPPLLPPHPDSSEGAGCGAGTSLRPAKLRHQLTRWRKVVPRPSLAGGFVPGSPACVGARAGGHRSQTREGSCPGAGSWVLGPEEPAQSSVVPCVLAARLFPPHPDRHTNFLTVEGTPRGRRIRDRTQVRNLCLEDCFYFILGCWRRKTLSGEPPSCILLGGRSRFWREDWQDGWEGPSLQPCDCPGRCGLLYETLLMTDPGRRGPACFDGGRCHQALHPFSRSLGL